MIKVIVDHSKHRTRHVQKMDDEEDQQKKSRKQIKSYKKQYQVNKEIILTKQDNLQKLNIIQQSRRDQVLNNIEQKQKIVRQTIEELMSDYKQVAQKVYANHGKRDKDRQRQIKVELNKFKKQKEQRHRKIEESNLKKSYKSLQIDKKSNRTRQSIQNKLKQIQQCKKQRDKDQKKFRLFYEQYKKIKPEYIKKVQQFQQKKHQQIDENNSKMKQKSREKYQVMDMEELDQFGEEYQKIKQEQKQKRQQQLNLNMRIEKKKDKYLKLLWKGQCHSVVEEQRILKKRKKQQAKEKVKRIKDYSAMIRENYQQRISSLHQSKLELENFLTIPQSERTGRKITLKQRYEKGYNRGLVIQHERTPLSQHEQTKIGNRNLKYMKSLPRAKKIKKNQQVLQLNILKPKHLVKSIKKEYNPLYEKNQENLVNFKQIDDYGEVKSALEKIKSIDYGVQEQQKVFKHKQYENIALKQKQIGKNSEKMVKNLGDKLAILSQMY